MIARIARLAAISTIALVGLTAAAFAASGVAYTKSAANLRSGPGTSYAVITTLPANSEVTVDACTATWCAVTTEDDDDGFIAKSLLKANPSGPDLPFSVQIIIGPQGPFLNFPDLFAPGPGPIVIQPIPDEPSADDEVCFYQQANYNGANFCVVPGDEDNHIPGSFDNNIESILISGAAGVEVCSGYGHSGECKYYTGSTKTLPSYLKNKISSYAVDDGNNGGDNGDGSFDIPDDSNGDFNLSF